MTIGNDGPDKDGYVYGISSLARLADNRSAPTIYQWSQRGLPFEPDGKRKKFKLDDVVEWCAGRGIDFYRKSAHNSTPINHVKRGQKGKKQDLADDGKPSSSLADLKLKQEQLKVSEMEFKQKLRDKEYLPVEEAEQIQLQLLGQLKQIFVEEFEKLLEESGLKGQASENLKSSLIKSFNRIADDVGFKK